MQRANTLVVRFHDDRPPRIFRDVTYTLTGAGVLVVDQDGTQYPIPGWDVLDTIADRDA